MIHRNYDLLPQVRAAIAARGIDCGALLARRR